MWSCLVFINLTLAGQSNLGDSPIHKLHGLLYYPVLTKKANRLVKKIADYYIQYGSLKIIWAEKTVGMQTNSLSLSSIHL